MLSKAEQEALTEIANKVAADVVSAIQTKPVTRYGAVNASGNLAESVRVELNPFGVRVLCDHYINSLIFGLPPGTRVPIQPLRDWVEVRGLDISPFAIRGKIFNKGTTIWETYHGADSGLLSDAINQSVIDRARKRLADTFVENLLINILPSLQKLQA